MRYLFRVSKRRDLEVDNLSTIKTFNGCVGTDLSTNALHTKTEHLLVKLMR
jgi:hypothetical protein